MLVHKPMPGYWYANEFGQLAQVRVVLYEGGGPRRVIVEYINGRRDCFQIEAWNRLRLCPHFPGTGRRRRKRQVD